MRKLLLAGASISMTLGAIVPSFTRTVSAATGPITWGKPQLVSYLPNGTKSNGYLSWVGYGAASGGGSGRIVFWSDGSQVLVRDRTYARTTRVAAAPAWGDALGYSWSGTLTNDAHLAAFASVAPNLVPGDTNGVLDVFLRDLWAFTTKRISVTQTGGQGNGESFGPVISGDGKYVAFTTWSNNLAAGTDGCALLLARLADGRLTRIDRCPDGRSWAMGMSRDGRYLLYEHAVSSEWPTVTAIDVWLMDRWSGQRWNVRGANAPASPWWPADLSGDGRRAVVEMFSPYGSQIYVYDRITNRTTLASQRADGSVPRRAAHIPSISDDGTWIAFTSDDTLIPGKPSGIFVRNLTTGALSLAVGRTAGITWPSGGLINLSGDARTVIYEGVDGRLFAATRTS